MRALPLLSVALAAVLAAGCLESPAPAAPAADEELPRFVPPRVLANLASGANVSVEDLLGDVAGLVTSVHPVGERGPEPSVGITSKGNIFYQALEKTMRSTDHGQTWTRVSGPLTAATTSDPWLWVDPDTDRIFQVNMVSLVCSHIAWSDDEGQTWLGNPMDCGPVPVNDHIKLGTGPWTGALSQLGMNPVYPNAVYYAYNKLVGGYMAVSLDGGATFPILNQMFASGCNGALHGAVATAPDGAVYVPARYCPGPLVAYSYDNGLTWNQIVVGESAGVPRQQKNPEIAVDTANNVYMDWVGSDNTLYLSLSRDRAKTWSNPVRVTPEAIKSVAFPTLVAGDPGRIGMAYLATLDDDRGAWEVGNATTWHVYYTYSLNALDPDPTFVTVRLTALDDPVQRGTICISSGACRDGNRNLLDFIDLTLDKDGRPYIAYADGCTSEACLSAQGTWRDSRSRDGYVGLLQAGPSLYEKVGLLQPLGSTSTG
jgi:hypothetical protein